MNSVFFGNENPCFVLNLFKLCSLFFQFLVVFLILSVDGLTRTLCSSSLSSSGYLVLDNPLDRETLDYYTLVVTASDGHPDGVRNSAAPHRY